VVSETAEVSKATGQGLQRLGSYTLHPVHIARWSHSASYLMAAVATGGSSPGIKWLDRETAFWI